MLTKGIAKVRTMVIVTAVLAVGLQFCALARADDEGKWRATATIYNTYCVQCHGMKRNGKGINAESMSVQPRDHSDAKGMGPIPDDEIIKAITSGGLSVNKSVLMPAWGKVLSPEQIRDLAAYMRHVCQCGPQAKP
jgi:cytochrome c oxidase cbb3-type subunit III